MKLNDLRPKNIKKWLIYGVTGRPEKTVEQLELLHRLAVIQFTVTAIVLFVIAAALKLIPSAIPFGLFEAWEVKDWNVLHWLSDAKWLFLWGTGFTALMSAITRNSKYENSKASKLMQLNAKVSLRAGFFEEIIYRWLLFLVLIVLLKVVNFFLLGFAGWGLIEGLYVHIISPVANFFTLGLLNEQFSNANWVIGAGIIAANARFRDGHKYLGPIGYVNSWFIGMYFFVLMFRYGLPAAITVHFIYDLLIFLVRFIDQKIEFNSADSESATDSAPDSK